MTTKTKDETWVHGFYQAMQPILDTCSLRISPNNWALPTEGQHLLFLGLLSKKLWVINIILRTLSMPLNWHHYFKKYRVLQQGSMQVIFLFIKAGIHFFLFFSHIWEIRVLRNLLTLVWLLPTPKNILFPFLAFFLTIYFTIVPGFVNS